MLRQYFPKGTDLSRHSRDELKAVASALNSRPRKTLGWKTPAAAASSRRVATGIAELDDAGTADEREKPVDLGRSPQSAQARIHP